MTRIKSNESNRILNAVNSFIDSLSKESKMLAIIDFDSRERFNWHYIPKARKGLSILDMTEQEKSNAKKILGQSLKLAEGKVEEICCKKIHMVHDMVCVHFPNNFDFFYCPL